MVIQLEFNPNNLKKGIWMNDDCGGSGILVDGKTPKELAQNVANYLVGYLSGEED